MHDKPITTHNHNKIEKKEVKKTENDISENNKQSHEDNMARRDNSGKLKGQIKNRAQIKNPLTGRWIKLDTKHGGIVGQKSTKGPYKNIKKIKKKR